MIAELLVIREISDFSNVKSNENFKISHNVNQLKNMLIISWSLTGAKVYGDSIYDESGNSEDLDSIALGKPVLVFRFSKVDCSKCIVEQIEIIRELTETKTINYAMVCDYKNQRALGLFKRTNGIKDIVYDCKELLNGESKTPYFFIYSKGSASDIFFPDDDFPELTRAYFNSVEKRYFNLNQLRE